ncbi:MAG: hypothetical protein V3R87_01875 [Dehalococcoidia bacterium]
MEGLHPNNIAHELIQHVLRSFGLAKGIIPFVANDSLFDFG